MCFFPGDTVDLVVKGVIKVGVLSLKLLSVGCYDRNGLAIDAGVRQSRQGTALLQYPLLMVVTTNNDH